MKTAGDPLVMRQLLTLVAPLCADALQHAFQSNPPSRFESPGTFEHVCVHKDLKEGVQVIFAEPAPNSEEALHPVTKPRGMRLPSEVPLAHSLRRGAFRYPASHAAKVNLVQSSSVYASIGQMLENSSINDVRFLGGTAFMMRTPCDVLADNYFNALTEEGPLLSRVLDTWRKSEGHDALEQRTLLLVNRCHRRPYRDDLRDLLLGRHHAVHKLLPGSLVCMKRLIVEASPPPDSRRGHELSLRRFVEHLKASAAAELLGEKENSGELPWNHQDVCAETKLDSTSQPYSYDATAEPYNERATEQPRPLLVAVIQRTRNRRIINANALLKKLRAGFAAEAAAIGGCRHRNSDMGRYEELMRTAVVEQVFFEDSSLMEQVQYMKRVDVLVGVTGSGLTNLAFLRPGSIVVELVSPSGPSAGQATYFSTLIARVHGSLGRGVLAYRRIPFEPAGNAHKRSIYGSSALHSRPDSPSTSSPRGHLRDKDVVEISPADYDAVVNVSAIVSSLLAELRWRNDAASINAERCAPKASDPVKDAT